jgi:hypothetical protein
MEAKNLFQLKDFFNYEQINQNIDIDDEKKTENRELAE